MLYTTQEKAWITQELLIRWIAILFPAVDTSPGRCIIWDSCSVHTSELVKDYCRNRGITLVAIPGGMTSFLQAGDIGIYNEFKAQLSPLINAWKVSGRIVLTGGGKPKPPATKVVRSWVLDAWNQVSDNTVRKCIDSAGLVEDYEHWYIAKHDVYGAQFREAWINSEIKVVLHSTLESIPQDDDIYVIDPEIEGLELDDDVEDDAYVEDVT